MPTEEALVIGLDIGGSKMLAGLISRAGEVQRVRQIATAPSPAEIMSAAQSLCESLIASAGLPVLAIGVGSAGVIDANKGSVIFANDNLPGWTGTKLAALGAAFDLPIAVENDVKALAFGEAVMGAGADYDPLLCIAVGTGVGGALILNGGVWHGADYCAGEIGSLVVDWAGDEPLILDQYASGPAIERAYQAEIGRSTSLPLRKIAQLARTGDTAATEAIKSKARRLGIILAGGAASFNPAAVVVGGGVPQIGALWWEAFEAGFREYLMPPLATTPLLPATLGVNAVMLGAAMLAWDEVGL